MSGLVVGALAALLLATALSGCAENGGAAQGTPAEEMGTLRGIVVDGAIRPLPNVQLSVRGPAGTLWANSTAGGVFEFAAALPFGVYVVAAHRAGFLDTYAAAEVDGGDRPVRIQMEA